MRVFRVNVDYDASQKKKKKLKKSYVRVFRVNVELTSSAIKKEKKKKNCASTRRFADRFIDEWCADMMCISLMSGWTPLGPPRDSRRPESLEDGMAARARCACAVGKIRDRSTSSVRVLSYEPSGRGPLERARSSSSSIASRTMESSWLSASPRFAGRLGAPARTALRRCSGIVGGARFSKSSPVEWSWQRPYRRTRRRCARTRHSAIVARLGDETAPPASQPSSGATERTRSNGGIANGMCLRLRLSSRFFIISMAFTFCNCSFFFTFFFLSFLAFVFRIMME